MNESLLNRILKDHKRRTRSLALILCLSMIVSLGTFAGFHQTAIAKVYTREVLDCPYAREGAEPVAHVHNDDCYDGGTLVCTLPEREAHTHDDSCYAESRLLTCSLEENPGHQHSEECFDENGELICQIPEGEGAHAHTDDCYTIERALVCNQAELPVHVHDAGCFRTEEISVDEPEEAIEPEQPVNTVPEMPVSDPNADLETADDWNREFENLELSGNWARDLVLVAATQQGRGESQNNFEAVLNDAGDAWVRHGYTRYGAWYGYPYAEWDAMFVSFCLRYAGIPAENVPNNPTAALMAESFSMGGLFAGRDYVPAVGDLIFFDSVDDEITTIDHMGIVYHVDAENGTINVVEGDRTDAVATFGYYLNDEQIVGYGILPQNPNYVPNEEDNTDNPDEAFDGFIFMTTDEKEEKQEETTTAEEAPAVPMPAQSWERTAGGIKVSVEAPEGAFPENTKIAVTPVNGSSLMDTVSDAVDGEVLEVQAVDITFFDADGREIEPAVPIRVVMTPAATENAEEKTSVVHVDVVQQTAELVEQAAGTEFDNSEVVFDADAFTIYAIVYTYQVEYEYEVDGKTFTSSMPGAENMSLTKIVEGLGIVGETEIETFVSKIASVASTNEEVAVVTEDNEVRVLKDGEAQIVITMQDGAAFSIDVSAEGITEISDENAVATVSTVNDLYLPASGEVKAELLTEEKSENAVAAVQTTAESDENSAAAESASYQAFSIALENVDVTAYDGFNVAVTLPENAVVGRDFQLYQVKEDGTATDLTESLTVTGEPNEDGLQNVSGFSFTTEDFADFVLSYSIETTYTTAGGDAYKITVNYGPKAGIPEDAELKVKEILPEDERYTDYLDESAAKLGVNSGDVSFARFFDIEIRKDGERIEPKAPVQVTISLTDAPKETTPEDLKVLHFAQTGLETIDATKAEKKEDETVELTFDAGSFSVYGVIVPPGEGGVDNLDGNLFTISNGNYYLAKGSIYNKDEQSFSYGNRNPWRITKTNNSYQAAVYYFEAAGEAGQYYIYTISEDSDTFGQKLYIHINHHGSGSEYGEDPNGNGSVNLSTYLPLPLTVTKNQSDGTYTISRTIDGTTYYLNHHYGNNGDGFATYINGDDANSKMTLTKAETGGEVTNPGKDNYRIMIVKYDEEYYIVNNDASLTEVVYHPENNSVEMDDPMMWTVEVNDSNSHIYYNSVQVGFDGTQQASDWYRRYLDPSVAAAWTQENIDNIGDGKFIQGTRHSGTIDGEEKTWYESKINRPTDVENNTTISISQNADNTYSISHDGQCLGLVLDAKGIPVRLIGNQSDAQAAEILFATPTGVNNASYLKNTVNHIDISISGTANISIPLAYGNYYGPEGDSADPIKTVSSNTSLELSEAQMDNATEQLRITEEDIKGATITTSCNGNPIDDAFYITGYSGNLANGTSNDQVRIEGAFLVADLRGTQYETIDKNLYGQYVNNGGNWSWTGNATYRNAVREQRLANQVEYTVTVIKPLTYKLVDPEVGQLYDEDGSPITVTIDVAFSASFTYWDHNTFGNECPAVLYGPAFPSHEGSNEWQDGNIDTSDWSGMDFKLGGNAEDENSPLVALEITKVIMDDQGNRIELKEPVTNYFDIYENKDANRNGVAGLHVNAYGDPDSRDATIHDGYGNTPWHTKRVTVGESGSAIVFDFDATDAMYYIVERHDEDSLPQTITDKNSSEWSYVKTYIETEYVRRGDQYDDKTAYPHPVHVTEDFTRTDGSYASIPEVAGKFTRLDNVQKKEGFLEFYVYNIYEKSESEAVTLPVTKTWADFASSNYKWTAQFQLQYMERKISGEGPDESVTEWTNYDPENILTIHKDSVYQQTVSSTFGDLPKYVERNGNVYERQYSAEELSFSVWRVVGGTDQLIYSYDGTNYIFGEGVDESIYKAFYDHDANENWDGNWNLQISNSVAQKIEPRNIDIGLEKEWKPDIPENASATFVLRRYVQTEYADYSATINNPAITVVLQDAEGNALGSIQTRSGMNVYVDATFAPDKTGTLTFLYNGTSYPVTNQSETGSKVTVRSAAIPVTGLDGATVVITLTDGDLSNLLEGGTYNLRITDHLTGTDPTLDSSFSQIVSFPISEKTGEEAWQYTFEDLPAEDGEWNADGTLANFNIYSYYLEETEVSPAEDNRLSIVDSNGNTISSSNRIYNEYDVTATNTRIGEHIHIEKRWYRLVANQMPPIVVRVTERDNNVVVTQDAYDAVGNVVHFNSEYQGYILDKYNGWAIDLAGLSANVTRRFEEIGIIIDGDPNDGYADGHLAGISELTALGYDTKHYYFSTNGTAPDESTHDKLVAMITDNGNVTSETSGTMFIYNVPEDAHYQLEVHKRWFSFNGETGLADITSTYGAAEGNGFIMQIQQRARWKDGDNARQIASDWVDYGQSFEVYKDHNTAVGFEEVIQGQEWLTTIQQRNVTRYGYAYNTSTHEYDVVEYEYRLVEIGVIDGNDGRIWSKNTVSNTDPDLQADKHRYEIENFEVGKIELQKYWNLEDQNKKASEVYFKIYSEWWFSSYGAEPGANGLYDVAEIIGRDINDPYLSAEEKAQIQSYWLRGDNITVKQVGSLGYVFAITGQGDQWSGLVRGLPLLVADPGEGAGNTFAEVEYTVAEVGAWYNGHLVKVGDSSWPYVEPLYYRNTRNQGLNRVDNGETFQIDNGTVDYQSFFRAINSDIPTWKFHAEKAWPTMPEAGASVVLELQALRLTEDVLSRLTATEEQEAEGGIKVSNLTQEQIQTLVALDNGWATAEIDNPSVVLPKSWDYVSMPENTPDQVAEKATAAARAWSVDWAGLPMKWKNASVESPEEYELLYRVVETSSPAWTTHTTGALTIGENYTFSQTVTNGPETDTSGELEITKKWMKNAEEITWPEGYDINYKVIQHAYLATVEETTTSSTYMGDGTEHTQTKKILTYHADTSKPLFEVDNFAAYTPTFGDNQNAESGKITSAQNPVTLHGLPKGAMWTAPDSLTDEMEATGIVAGQTYSIAYGYEIVETGVTSGSTALPFTATSGSLDVNTVSSGTLENTLTDVTVQKNWQRDGTLIFDGDGTEVTNDQWPTGYTIGYKVIREIMMEKTVGEEVQSVKVGEELVFTSGSTTALSSSNPSNTISNLPTAGYWAAVVPADTDAWKSSYEALALTAGESYAATFTYRVEEATTDVEGSVAPEDSDFIFSAIKAVFDDITKAYVITNDLTEVKVIKVWQGYTPQTGDKVGVKLYVSTTAPGDTERVNVTTAMSWTTGTVAPDTFSVPVTITGVDSKGNTVETRSITLNQDNQTITTAFEKYDDYDGLITYTVTIGDPTGEIANVAISGSNTVSGNDGTVTITATGAVPQNTGSITFVNNSNRNLRFEIDNNSPLSVFNGTALNSGTSYTFNELTPGQEYQIKMSGFESADNPGSDYPDNVTYHGWGNTNGYWVTATANDTLISIFDEGASPNKVAVSFRFIRADTNSDWWGANIQVGIVNFNVENRNTVTKYFNKNTSYDVRVNSTWGPEKADKTCKFEDGSVSFSLAVAEEPITINMIFGDGNRDLGLTNLLSRRLPILQNRTMLATSLVTATSKIYTGDVTTTTITLPDSAVASQTANVVGKAGLPHGAVCLTETEVELSAAVDSTTNAAWSHLWKDLPKTDAEGNTLYYYVVETSATVGGSTVTATYTRTEATETEPATITITNKVENDQKYGSLKVTKELTGVTTDNWWTKAFKFTLKNSAGKYLKNASPYDVWQDGTDGAEFTVTPSTAILFEHLPVGNYVITETSTSEELAITAYEYDSAGSVPGTGDEGITVSETNTSANPVTFKLENKYNPKKTNVTVTKAWNNADDSHTAPAGATVTFKLYQNETEVAGSSISLDGTVDENGEATAWVASWTDLPAYDGNEEAYTYTVKEVVDENGYSWQHYVVSYPKDGTLQEEKTSASSGETITNTETTTDLTVDKQWFASAADATAGTPEKDPTQTTIYYKIMQKLGENNPTVYSFSGSTVQTLTYDTTGKDWTPARHDNLPVKVYVKNTEDPTRSEWLDASYYVVECDSEGNALSNTDYSVTYKKNSGNVVEDPAAATIVSSDTARTITIINTDAFVEVKILKVDSRDQHGLEGAQFQILRKNETGTYVVYTGNGVDTDGKFSVGSTSGITLSLPAGEYKVIELKAPDGYVISSDSTFYFKVINGAIQYTDANGTEITNDSELLVKHTAKTSTDPATFKVGNRPGQALPMTGGIGTSLFTALGAILTSTAGAALVLKKRKEE